MCLTCCQNGRGALSSVKSASKGRYTLGDMLPGHVTATLSLEHASNAVHTEELFPLHLSAICPLVCAELNTISFSFGGPGFLISNALVVFPVSCRLSQDFSSTQGQL